MPVPILEFVLGRKGSRKPVHPVRGVSVLGLESLSFIIRYVVVWWCFFRRSRFTLILTLEHEITHALFAIVTFHRVTGLRATAFRGGQVRFVGEGNWLITVAPYFFPH